MRAGLIRVITVVGSLSLLHLGQIVITFRTLLHLGQNVLTFRTLLHLGPFITFRPSTAASDRFYPNASEVFEGLPSLLQHCGDCVKENTDGGHAEFLARRQEEYQRPLCDLWVMYGRVTESAQENQLTQDLELLMQVMDSRLQSLGKLNSDFHYLGNKEESSTTQNSQLLTLERSGNAEYPARRAG